MDYFWSNGISKLVHADARELPLPDNSVHCVVTSPPYWGIRNYGLGNWEGGSADCEHSQRAPGTPRQTISGSSKYRENGLQPAGSKCTWCGAIWAGHGIGLEPTLAEHIENIVQVGREVWRVLRDDGTFWLNYGDVYDHGHDKDRSAAEIASAKGQFANPRASAGRHVTLGRAKNLLMLPSRIALALQDDGWILRSAIVWHKLNPMPESVSDRPTNGYEMIYLLTKQQRYYYDIEAIRQPLTGGAHAGRKDGQFRPGKAHDENDNRPGTWNHTYTPSSARARNVWTFATQGRGDAHFATFPDELPRRCILSGTSEKGACSECGKQWERVIEKPEMPHDIDPNTKYGENSNGERIRRMLQYRRARGISDTDDWSAKTVGWQPTCGCEAEVVPATVFDPFVGSGTTCAVAQALGRRSVGTDLNHEYLGIAMKRIEGVSMPMVMTT